MSDFFYNVHRWYQPATGRYTRVDPLGLRDGPNSYQYAWGNPVNRRDPRGLAVLICSRDSYLPIIASAANHAYFWDDRDGVLPDRRSCGRGAFHGREAGPPEDQCKPIPGSDGGEDALMNCCRRKREISPFFPYINDCQSILGDCIEEAGLPETLPPGERFGRPCDQCPVEPLPQIEPPPEIPGLFGSGGGR